MKKEKHPKDENENTKEMNSEEINKGEENQEASKTSDVNGDEAVNAEIQDLKAKLEEKAKQCEDLKNMVQRTAAEFDNYKKEQSRKRKLLALI